MISFKGAHFPKEIILMAVRWYLAYPLSYRHVEELLKERGLATDHATINRWVIKYAPLLENESRKYKKNVGKSWRMDETYIKVKGNWVYYYRAVDKRNNTIDFYLSEKRDLQAAKAFLKKAISHNGLPEKVNIDKSGANLAALEETNLDPAYSNTILIRQIKYLNDLIEQDHRAIKRITRTILGFKDFASAEATLAGIELCHMIKKGQLAFCNNISPWQQFYSLAA
jgi:transposase-like protein